MTTARVSLMSFQFGRETSAYDMMMMVVAVVRSVLVLQIMVLSTKKTFCSDIVGDRFRKIHFQHYEYTRVTREMYLIFDQL